MKRTRQLQSVLVVLVVAAVATTFTSWGVSGSVGRNSYELVDSSRALGLLDDGLVRYAPAWFGLPFAAAAVVIAVAMGRIRLASALAAGVGLAMVIGWMTVKSSPVGVDTGAVAGAMLGATTIVVAVLLLLDAGTTGRDQQLARPTERSEPADRSRSGGADREGVVDARTAAAPSSAREGRSD